MSLTASPAAALFTPLPQAITEGVAHIQRASNWQEKYRQIMLLGKQLPEFPAHLQQDAAQVKGCESNAWLYHQAQDNQHYFIASSDARIVKGLIAIILSETQGKSRVEISQYDLNKHFQQLGLSGQLSPSRTNGITALANAILAFSQQGS
ncbi:SufE family protein [Shewanella intestini]|uniref:SufE family protein n=1 Tax=Shewanella intestini TaxID=2017544 RepID=A0ABS5I1T2_9GAMM|nr:MULTISPECIES: SufE family protein [Shewanella]MBR9727980.1 SufE family protein [Shewanella intestini]MRG36469.1 Fe-S metabolism protein SufE [Shewanella sp. XMDDZSB0408]